METRPTLPNKIHRTQTGTESKNPGTSILTNTLHINRIRTIQYPNSTKTKTRPISETTNNNHKINLLIHIIISIII